jgi:hypothetical protein
MFPSLNLLFRIRHDVSSSQGFGHNARKICGVNTFFCGENTQVNSVVLDEGVAATGK